MRVRLGALALALVALAAGARAGAHARGGGWAPALELEPWAEELSAKASTAHARMAAYLADFFARTPPALLAPPPPRLPITRARGARLPARNATLHAEAAADPHRWARWNASAPCDAVVAAALGAGPPPRRTNLLIAPVGSAFDARAWLTHPAAATYDVVALYYGSDDDFTCPLCRAVVRGGGTKWFLLRQLATRNASLWAVLLAEYDAFMVPDDDLLFDTCALNRAFELFAAYGLLMAQPSLCKTPYRSTFWEYLMQREGPARPVLRYVTFVEIMAPIFSRALLEELVVPLLHNAYTGWGVDFTLPFLLRYPSRHVAVLDDVCATHAAASGQKLGEGNIYAVPVPYGEREEEARRVGEFGYHPSRTEAMGFEYRAMVEHGRVERRFYSRAALEAARAEAPAPGILARLLGAEARFPDDPRAALVVEGFRPAPQGLGAGGGTLTALGVAAAALALSGAAVARRRRRGRRGGGGSPAGGAARRPPKPSATAAEVVGI